MILVKKCCNQKLVLDHDAILKQFENQFVTNEKFQSEKARILATVQDRLLEASKRSLNDLIDGKLVTLIRPNLNETSETNKKSPSNPKSTPKREKKVSSRALIGGRAG